MRVVIADDDAVKMTCGNSTLKIEIVTDSLTIVLYFCPTLFVLVLPLAVGTGVTLSAFAFQQVVQLTPQVRLCNRSEGSWS